MKTSRYLFFVLLSAFLPLSAQQKDSLFILPSDGGTLLEDSREEFEEEGIASEDWEDWARELADLKNNPLNVNDLDNPKWIEVLHLSEYRYYQLRKYVDMHGSILSWGELAAVEGFDAAWVQAMRPYLEVGEWKPSLRAGMKKPKSRSEFLLRHSRILESQAAYEDDNGRMYEGSPDMLLLKYTYRRGRNFKMGLVAEKDAGESFFRASNLQGFDFYSFYLSYEGKRGLQRLLAGDYQLQLGQGIAMEMGYQPQSLSPESLQKESFLKAHSSAGEGNFLRGMAAQFRLSDQWRSCVFFSLNRVDAQKEESDSSVSAVYRGGYHRTATEIGREANLRQLCCGVRTAYRGNALEIGIGVYGAGYTSRLEKEWKTYSQFRYASLFCTNFSADYQYIRNHLFLNGETVFDIQGRLATSHICVFHPDDRVQFSLGYRYMGKAFQSVSDLLSQSASHSNEQTFALRFRMLSGQSGEWNLSWEQSYYPWLKYRIDAPSEASDFQCRYAANLNAENSMLCVYRWKCSQQNLTLGNIRVLENKQRHSFRFRWKAQASPCWSFRLQWDAVAGKQGASSWQYATVLSQEVAYTQERWKCVYGLALFDTDSYDVRIGISERDVLYAMSSVVCMGRGIRNYLLLSFCLTSSIHLYVKAAVHTYADREEIGSGPTLIKASHKSEVKSQLVWKF